MEAVRIYDRPTERARLRVVNDGATTYSALPHDIMRNVSLTPAARLLYAVLQGHWWQSGECWASHATLAAEMGCTTRSLRAYLDELIAADAIVEQSAGARRAKVYSPHPFRTDGPETSLPNTSKPSDCQPSNTSKFSDWDASNEKETTVQSENFDSSNEKETTYLYKKTPEKKTKEEDKKRSGSAEPAPSPGGRVIDLIVAAGIPKPTFSGRDGKALKETGADPELVAEAYCALFRGEWGDDFMRRSISVAFVVGRLAGYQAFKRQPRVNGKSSIPPGAASKQTSKWADFKGRHGGNVVGRGQP